MFTFEITNATYTTYTTYENKRNVYYLTISNPTGDVSIETISTTI